MVFHVKITLKCFVTLLCRIFTWRIYLKPSSLTHKFFWSRWSRPYCSRFVFFYLGFNWKHATILHVEGTIISHHHAVFIFQIYTLFSCILGMQVWGIQTECNQTRQVGRMNGLPCKDNTKLLWDPSLCRGFTWRICLKPSCLTHVSFWRSCSRPYCSRFVFFYLSFNWQHATI